MPTIIKITKLPTGLYEVIERFDFSEQTSHVDKSALENGVKILENVIFEKNELLAYKKNLLTEIKKVP